MTAKLRKEAAGSDFRRFFLGASNITMAILTETIYEILGKLILDVKPISAGEKGEMLQSIFSYSKIKNYFNSRCTTCRAVIPTTVHSQRFRLQIGFRPIATKISVLILTPRSDSS